jgi:small subunit ribosomal protein S10
MNVIATNTGASNSEIVIKLFSYESCLIRQAVELITKSLSDTGVYISGSIPMPTRRKCFVVNRSPHIDKKSRERFSIHVHVRIIKLRNFDSKVTDRLLGMTLPNGIGIKIKYSE